MNKLLILFIFLLAQSIQAATLTVNKGFESGTLTGMTCSGNCPKIATSPIMTGNYSGNFDLTRSMTTNFRTEVEGIQNFYFGQEYWLGFNYRYEDWATDTSSEMAPFQIHTKPLSWSLPKECSIGAAWATAPFFMGSNSDQAGFYTYGGKSLWKGAVQKKQWLGIVVHFKISASSDGFIEAWKNGVKLGRVDGANSPKTDKCGNPMREPYFKMGVYKWDWKTKTTASSRRQLIIDNLKIAQGADGLTLVSSAAAVQSPPPPPVIDTTPPVLSFVQALAADTTATITWTTDEASDSCVKYDVSCGYGEGITICDANKTVQHKIVLNNLLPAVFYQYQAISTDAANNKSYGEHLNFSTSKPPIP